MAVLLSTPRFDIVSKDEWDRRLFDDIACAWMDASALALKEIGHDEKVWGCWTPHDCLPLYVGHLVEFRLCQEIDTGVMMLLKLEAIKEDVTAALRDKGDPRAEEFSGLLDMFLLWP